MSAGVVESRRDDLGTPGALVARVVGERSDDADVGVVRQREHAVVRQQHGARGRGRSGEPVVGHLVDDTPPSTFDFDGRPSGECGDRRGTIEDQVGEEFTGLDGVDDLLIVGPTARWHLEVDPGSDCRARGR